MHKGWRWLAVCALAAGCLAARQGASQETGLIAQWNAAPVKVTGKGTCACGAHPPAPAKDRVVEPYAGEPKDLSPYEKFAQPYFLNYIHPNIYTGAARDIPEPKDLSEVRIGFLGPLEHTSDSVFGIRMLHGAQLAIEEANAHGGYGGKPFKLILHNDYNNWQKGAVYGNDRPTDPAIWGSPSDEAVKMIYDEKVWAIFGSISSESTHIIVRVVLKAETPIVNSASTDPTIPETYVPWFFTDIQDDRVQSLTLARRIFTELGLKRPAILRVNNRYGRFGVLKLRDASRRLGHPIVIEQKYFPGDTDYSRQLKVIRGSRADAIVLWADEDEAARILKQMRAMGMKQRVFGAYRTLGPTLLAEAGPAAEGFEAVFPYDPTRQDPKWIRFNQRFENRFNEKPEQFAALAYDAMNVLLDSICKAGLNRARIQDALDNVREYDGVTAHMIFDPNMKNVAPMYLGTVHNGAISYRVATMEPPAAKAAEPPVAAGKAAVTPYARVGEGGVEYAGPQRADVPAGPVRVVLFGPGANEFARSPEAKAELAAEKAKGREWTLVPVGSDQNWSAAGWKVWAASDDLVHAILDGHALAIVALDRDASHLAEQLALKSFVPVLALSDDKALTSINIPWIFRLPERTKPVEALRLLEAAEQRSGPNPERLRGVLASGREISGVAFLPTGEPRGRD
jgi:branched-chain amino acid transport system substrate-binding protein